MSYRAYVEKILIFGLYFLLLTPLFFQQSLMNPLITLKTLILQAVIEILFACYLWLIIFYPEYRPRLNVLSMSLLVLLGALILSAVFGVNWHRSFWSVPERMTGVFLWLHLAVLFFILISLREKVHWIKYLSFSTVVSFFVALFPVVQLIFPDIFFEKITGRLTGTLGNAIFLGIYLLFHVFLGSWLAAHFFKRGRKLLADFFGIIVGFDLLVIFLTETRSVFLGLIIGFLFLTSSYLYKAYRNHGIYKPHVSYLIYSLLVLLVVFGLFFFFTRNQLFWQSVPLFNRFAGQGLNIFGPRLFAWKAAGQSFLEKPLLGWGWENFYYAFNKYYDPHLLKFGFGETYFDRPHNVYLEFLATTGLLGLLAYLWLLATAFKQTCRLSEGRQWFQALLIAYMVYNFFAFDTLTSYLMFVVVLGFINSADNGYVKT